MNPLAIPAIIEIGGKLIDRFFPDKAKAEEAKLELLRMTQAGEFKQIDALVASDVAQAKVNEEEAKSDDLFKAGWRPAVGWTCAGGLFYQLIARPMLGWLAENWLGWKMPPALEMETLLTLLFGMLGLGYYRTREKLGGKA